MLQAGRGAGAVGGQLCRGSLIESGGQQFECGQAYGIGLCCAGQFQQLWQEFGLRVECQQSDGCGALFCWQSGVECGVAGGANDAAGEVQSSGLFLPCGGEAAATAAEAIVECCQQF